MKIFMQNILVLINSFKKGIKVTLKSEEVAKAKRNYGYFGIL